MSFVREGGAATVLVLLTVWLQSAGMAALIYWGRPYLQRAFDRRAVYSALLIVWLTIVIIGLHMLETVLWAGFYRWQCFPSWEISFYFSMSSYSSIGAADVVLPPMWKTLSSIECITGELMCGLSVSLVFAAVTRLVEKRPEEVSGPRAE
jgi:voltage-gated potassium channel